MNTIVTFSFVIQIKYSSSFNCRFLYVSEPLTSVKKELESLFEAHIEEGTPDESPERQDPDAKENVNGDMIHKYIPTSPRNRLMYLLLLDMRSSGTS